MKFLYSIVILSLMAGTVFCMQNEVPNEAPKDPRLQLQGEMACLSRKNKNATTVQDFREVIQDARLLSEKADRLLNMNASRKSALIQNRAQVNFNKLMLGKPINAPLAQPVPLPQ